MAYSEAGQPNFRVPCLFREPFQGTYCPYGHDWPLGDPESVDLSDASSGFTLLLRFLLLRQLAGCHYGGVGHVDAEENLKYLAPPVPRRYPSQSIMKLLVYVFRTKSVHVFR